MQNDSLYESFCQVYYWGMNAATAGGPPRAAFSLAQVGALAASHFAERTNKIGLTPSDAGVLRILSRTPGMSQRMLATRLGAVPSRVVALIDSLQGRGLVERVRSSADRRNYELHLTAEGVQAVHELRHIAARHESEFLGALSPAQVSQLQGLLELIARAHGLEDGVHPGYRAR